MYNATKAIKEKKEEMRGGREKKRGERKDGARKKSKEEKGRKEEGK